MPARVVRDLCDGDGACVEACPVDCMRIDSENVAVVEKGECIECGTCIDVCPKAAIDWA